MLTLSQYAKRAKVSRQYVHKLLIAKRISGAKKVRSPGVRGGWIWQIPASAKIG